MATGTRPAVAADLAACGDRFRALVREAAARARARGTPVLAALTHPLPAAGPDDLLALFARLARHEAATLWLPPEGPALLGLGNAGFPAPQAPAALERAWREAVAGALLEVDVPGPAVALLGGLAFDPQRPADAVWEGFPRRSLLLPRLLVGEAGGRRWCTLAAWVGPAAGDGEAELALALLAALGDGDDGAEEPAPIPAGAPETRDEPDRAAWRRTVTGALDEIARGRLRKLVVARRRWLRASAPFDPGAALRRLRAAEAGVTVFAVARGGRCFLGATPERLLRLTGTHLEVDCLAGSAPRGGSSAEDAARAAALLASGKDRDEHGIVVAAVREALAPYALALEVPPVPRIRRLRHVQHLYTPVRAWVRPGTGALALLARLHPTPAVAGWPREEALACLRRLEPFDRGLYAGPVGWVGPDGGGEFAVAIRSGLLAGATAVLYAGGGIVPGSDPDREYEETGWKLAALAEALGAGTGAVGPGGGPSAGEGAGA